MRVWMAGAVALMAMAVVTAVAYGHAERLSYYPDYKLGKVPKYRKSGPARVVCKSDSGRRIRRQLHGKARKHNLALLKRCRYRHIQQAVNAAKSGDRILILPGVYREEPSRRVPEPDPKCKDDYEEYADPHFGAAPDEKVRVANFEYQRKCKNAQNLIAIIGDGPDKDRRCDHRCNLQIEGTGTKPSQVLIDGKRSKLNVIRADRADGIHLRNFTVQFSDFNNIYVLETNGFRLEKIVSRWSREYGFLSFTSDNGLYRKLTAYGSGDSGIYPGSGPEGHCKRYGIEVDRVNSYGNTIGWSGTAGNGIYTHDSRFHHNATGITTDSFAGGHPGMPQDCSKWEDNRIYSNNYDLFNEQNDQYCYIKNRPIAERDPKHVCPAFQVPVGTGMLIGGGNDNIVKNNYFYDNWRQGAMLFWVPSAFRGTDPTGQSQNSGPAYDSGMDTSLGNRYEGNVMGVRPNGARDPNGVDFWWDEEGRGNCWTNNKAIAGGTLTSNPGTLPDCPGSSLLTPADPVKLAMLAACSSWDPQDDVNQDPPGCDWFTRPPEPR
ncbi:MAG TPA: right-handed parallel beta-helix repeat-containing protein [Thermoleophilaceae bacterium]